MIKLLIEHDGKAYEPIVQEGVTWSTERKSCPGTLQFKVLKDGVLDFTEGDVVKLAVDDTNLFFGFVFKKKRDKDGIIEVMKTL